MSEHKLNVVSDLQGLPVAIIKDIYAEHAMPDAVVAINVSGDLNIGMSIRTASLFGIGKFYILGRRSYDRRTTVGQHNYIDVEPISCSHGYHSEDLDVDKAIAFLEQLTERYQLVFVEQADHKVNLLEMTKKLSAKLPCCFVVGNEGVGIPRKIIDSVKGITVEIPQRGVGRSHNVANALSIVLWEYFREKI